jgi:hypothetical protein
MKRQPLQLARAQHSLGRHDPAAFPALVRLVALFTLPQHSSQSKRRSFKFHLQLVSAVYIYNDGCFKERRYGTWMAARVQAAVAACFVLSTDAVYTGDTCRGHSAPNSSNLERIGRMRRCLVGLVAALAQPQHVAHALRVAYGGRVAHGGRHARERVPALRTLRSRTQPVHGTAVR